MKKNGFLTASAMIVALLATSPAFSASSASTTPAQQAPIMGRKEMPMNPAMEKRHEAMMKVREANRETIEQMAAKRKELNAIIEAEKFDKGAYIKKSGEIEELKRKMEGSRAEVMADSLSKMSLEERKAMAAGPMRRHMRDRAGKMGEGKMNGGMMGKGMAGKGLPDTSATKE